MTWTKRPSGVCSTMFVLARVTPDDAVAALRRLPYADLGFARVDHHRALRQGRPEAIYGPGKTPEQCAAIVVELLDAGAAPVLLTRDARPSDRGTRTQSGRGAAGHHARLATECVAARTRGGHDGGHR